MYWARIAALDAYYNISETDNHYLQVIQNLETSQMYAKQIAPSIEFQIGKMVTILKTRDPKKIEPAYLI